MKEYIDPRFPLRRWEVIVSEIHPDKDNPSILHIVSCTIKERKQYLIVMETEKNIFTVSSESALVTSSIKQQWSNSNVWRKSMKKYRLWIVWSEHQRPSTKIHWCGTYKEMRNLREREKRNDKKEFSLGGILPKAWKYRIKEDYSYL